MEIYAKARFKKYLFVQFEVVTVCLCDTFNVRRMHFRRRFKFIGFKNGFHVSKFDIIGTNTQYAVIQIDASWRPVAQCTRQTKWSYNNKTFWNKHVFQEKKYNQNSSKVVLCQFSANKCVINLNWGEKNIHFISICALFIRKNIKTKRKWENICTFSNQSLKKVSVYRTIFGIYSITVIAVPDRIHNSYSIFHCILG